MKTSIPRATYRLQFNRYFTFAQAAEIVPYLAALGISHIYASPYLKARPGSLHGYDIVDHNALNPEIGTWEEFEHFVAICHQHNLRQMLDIVPNHMGVMGSDNAWWLDVLENGEASRYAHFFDIDWYPLREELRGKVLVPVLGDHYGTVLTRGEIKLDFNKEKGEFSLHYYTHRFPIDPQTYPYLLGYDLNSLHSHSVITEFRNLITALNQLPKRNERDPSKIVERRRDQDIYKHQLAQLYSRSVEVAQYLTRVIDKFNGEIDKSNDSARFDLLHELIKAQAYRFSFWRVAADDINYRRFFDINDLAALRMENEEVFETTHRFILHLIQSGKVNALRIDHPDGLYDPAQYFKRLQESFLSLHIKNGNGDNTKPLYVVIEKILARYEHLPKDWAVYGTTGYHFANLVNGLFIDETAQTKLDRLYHIFTHQEETFDEIVYRSKKLIMRTSLASELNVLATQLARIAEMNRYTCDFTLHSLRDALMEVIAWFPVYRTFITETSVSPEARRYIEWATAVAKKHSDAADRTVFDFVRNVLTTDIAQDKTPAYRKAVLNFAMRFQQYTGPVMAKGYEDTSLYIYHRLVSLNEVGGDPRQFSISVNAFHSVSQENARTWPHTLLATSTHDNKRSEDVRARMNVLSEIPAAWRLALRRWQKMNKRKKTKVEGSLAPSNNDEYLLYQTLLGVWPLEDLDEAGLEQFSQRIDTYMLKAIREAKVISSWTNPNTAYENALSQFIQALLTPRHLFLHDFLLLQRFVSWWGMHNSLSQTLIKLTSPGVPDVYQGNEIWDFSLVDPDNRRPIDYSYRHRLLDEIIKIDALPTEQRGRILRDMLNSMQDGRVKLYLTWKVLNLSRHYVDLFQYGNYTPLSIAGEKSNHICAYARRYQNKVLITVAPRLYARLMGENGPNDTTTMDAESKRLSPLGETAWGNTQLEIPNSLTAISYKQVLTSEQVFVVEQDEKRILPIAILLRTFPIALLMAA